MEQTPPSSQSSQTFGRYTVRKLLGAGGFGHVYLAWDPQLQRDVALKVIRSQFLADETARKRFEREAHVMARLEHPAIVPIYEFGQIGEDLFLAMRLMPGGSLANRIDMGALTAPEAVAIVERLARGLDAAHLQNVIHRDFKPDNVLFDREGQPCIADFGFAKLLEASALAANLSQNEAWLGTPAYMSPEQWEGKVTIDGRADLYALGVIFYEMLTGRLPFGATTASTMMYAHLNEPPPPVSNVRPDVPTHFDHALSRALAKRPEGRYRTAGEFADALRLGETAPVVVSVPVSFPPPPASRPPAPGPIPATRSGVTRQAEASLRRSTLAPVVNTVDLGERLLKYGAGFAMMVALLVAFFWWTGGSPSSRLVDGHLPVEPGRIAVKFLNKITAHGFVVRKCRFLPDGILAAVCGQEGGVAIVNTMNGQRERVFAGHERIVPSLALSPDGLTLATASLDGTVRLWDAKTAAQKTSLVPPGERVKVCAVVFGRPENGNNLLYSSDWGGYLRVWDIGPDDNRNELRDSLIAHASSPVNALALSPDGRILATGASDGLVRFWDVASRQQIREIFTGRGEVQTLAFSPNGKILASAGSERRVRLWDTVTGEALRDLHLHFEQIRDLAFSPDGRLLASASGDKTVGIWDPASGALLQNLGQHTDGVFSVDFSPDGHRLITGSMDKSINLWELP